MSLAEKLDAIRDGSNKRIPAEKRSIMHRATEELRNSGIMDAVIKIGDPLPPIALPNQRGVVVQSTELFATGAVVLTVFRGHW
jgi:hypothetical protein